MPPRRRLVQSYLERVPGDESGAHDERVRAVEGSRENVGVRGDVEVGHKGDAAGVHAEFLGLVRGAHGGDEVASSASAKLVDDERAGLARGADDDDAGEIAGAGGGGRGVERGEGEGGESGGDGLAAGQGGGRGGVRGGVAGGEGDDGACAIDARRHDGRDAFSVAGAGARVGGGDARRGDRRRDGGQGGQGGHDGRAVRGKM